MFDTGTLVPIAFFLSVSFILVGITKVISDGRTRRRLIEAGASPELARAIVAAPKDDPGLYSALRWGILTGAVGLALILIQFLPYRSDEPIVFAGDFNITAARSEALRVLAGAESLTGATATGIDQVLSRGLRGAPGEPWPVARRTVEGRILSDHPPVDRELT